MWLTPRKLDRGTNTMPVHQLHLVWEVLVRPNDKSQNKALLG